MILNTPLVAMTSISKLFVQSNPLIWWLTLILSVFAQLRADAQVLGHTENSCATQNPGLPWEQEFQRLLDIQHNEKSIERLTSASTYTIPLVFHVIHSGEQIGTYPNIDSAQIYATVEVLNQDFNGVGLNSSNYPANAFVNWAINQSLPPASIDSQGRVKIANLDVLFCPAIMDTIGNILPEPGINRIDFNALGIADPASYTDVSDFQNYLDSALKPLTIWNVEKYLNVWITDKNASFPHGGIATTPPLSGLAGPGLGGTDSTDGVWVYTKSVGSPLIYPQGNYANPLIRGRTLTHELGHWLGLWHNWGPTSCSTDFCDDTPPSAGPSVGNPAYPDDAGSCNNPTNAPDGEMYMNFMDYTADPYKYMFTEDQAIRMRTALQNSPHRNQLGTHNLCGFVTQKEKINGVEDELLLYPNPTEGQITFELKRPSSFVIINIRSIRGELLQSELAYINGPYSMELNHPSGLYLLEIQEDHGTRTVKKIIIK